MSSGCIDVRTREEKRLGKMRIDQLADMFDGLMPERSKNFKEFYSKSWKSEDFPVTEIQPKPVEKVDESKQQEESS